MAMQAIHTINYVNAYVHTCLVHRAAILKMASSCSKFKRKTFGEIAELTDKQRDMYNRQLQAETERLQNELQLVRLEEEAMTKELHAKQELNRMIAAGEVLVVNGRLVWPAEARGAGAGAEAERRAAHQRRVDTEQRRVEAVAAAAAYAAYAAKSPASPKRRRLE